MNWDHYGYPIFPGERRYSSSLGDVDRFDRDRKEERTMTTHELLVEVAAKATIDARGCVVIPVELFNRICDEVKKGES